MHGGARNSVCYFRSNATVSSKSSKIPLSIPIVHLYFCPFRATTSDTNNGPRVSFRFATFTLDYALLLLQRRIIVSTQFRAYHHFQARIAWRNKEWVIYL